MLMDNYTKYETYRSLMADLKKSLGAGFYYQAIFIEYAIFEDRLTALLKYANKKYKDKNGQDYRIQRKINKIKTEAPFTESFERKRISLELLEQIETWKERRNKKIHKMADLPQDEAEIKEIAEEGYEILKVFMNKAKSVNNRHKKTIWEGNGDE